MLLGFECIFINFFSSSKYAPVSHHNFVNTAKTASAKFPKYFIITNKTFTFHFNKFIPLDLYFFVRGNRSWRLWVFGHWSLCPIDLVLILNFSLLRNVLHRFYVLKRVQTFWTQNSLPNLEESPHLRTNRERLRVFLTHLENYYIR